MTDRGPWIPTYTGKRFYPLDPRPEDVCIEDIAHALANICRFGGHVREFYSVAQHSVLVSRHVPAQAALHGLLHDAAEAYIGDVVAPIKALSLFKMQDDRGAWVDREEFAAVEGRILGAIFDALDVDPSCWGAIEISRIDKRLCLTEGKVLMAGGIAGWHLAAKCNPLDIEITPWSPLEAERRFLLRWEELAGERKAEEAA